MAKSKVKTKVEAATIPAPARKMTRMEFWQAQHEKVRQNPAYGIELAKRAGILDEEGNLTPYFKGE